MWGRGQQPQQELGIAHQDVGEKGAVAHDLHQALAQNGIGLQVREKTLRAAVRHGQAHQLPQPLVRPARRGQLGQGEGWQRRGLRGGADPVQGL